MYVKAAEYPETTWTRMNWLIDSGSEQYRVTDSGDSSETNHFSE